MTQTSDAVAAPAMNKDIFPYDNGERVVKGDPIALWRRFCIACEGDPDAWVRASEDKDNAWRAAEFSEKVLAAVRTAFRLTPWDDEAGTGAQDQHAYAAISGLLDFL